MVSFDTWRPLGTITKIAVTLVVLLAPFPAPAQGTSLATDTLGTTIVAVVPFSVGSEPNPNLISAHLRWTNWRKTEAYAFQSQLYSALVKQKSGRPRQPVRYQDLELTNALLMQAGIDDQSIGTYSASELAGILNVDAIVSGSIGVMPMQRARVNAERAATAFGSVVTGIFGQLSPAPVDEAEEFGVTVNIHDGSTGELLWTHERNVDYWDSTAPEKNIDRRRRSLMNRAAREAPYSVAL